MVLAALRAGRYKTRGERRPMLAFFDRTALITETSTGIGRAPALKPAAPGWVDHIARRAPDRRR